MTAGDRRIDHPAVGPSADLERWARKTPDRTALAWSGGRLTFGELSGQVAMRSGELASDGVAPGSVASLDFREGPNYFRDLLALWHVGAVVAPHPLRSTDREREQLDRLFRPSWRLDAEGNLEATDPTGGVLSFDGEAGVSALVRTSGTGGAPTGVVLSHAAFMASAAASRQRLGLSSEDRWGLALSTAHVGGLGTVVRALQLGSSLRFWPAFEPRRLAKAIREGDLTHISVVPAMCSALLDDGLTGPVETFRCLLVGGAHMPDSLLQETARRDLPVALSWGLTEATAQVATAPPDVVARFPGTVGLPLDGVEVDVGPEGRMGVRGPTLAHGIVPEPGAAAVPLPLDSGGWFRTEDVGSIDDGGRLWIEGRADDVIVSGGTNVHPREVEAVLSEAAGVKEVAVFGIADDRWGQVVVAAVVSNADQPSGADLDRHCRAHLTRGKCPTHIVFVDGLPRTLSGKVAKSRLPELLSQAP
ncbi:MAG: class I adenylate-forming enzyme family protein [Longimicrobiales bacterium]